MNESENAGKQVSCLVPQEEILFLLVEETTTTTVYWPGDHTHTATRKTVIVKYVKYRYTEGLSRERARSPGPMTKLPRQGSSGFCERNETIVKVV